MRKIILLLILVPLFCLIAVPALMVFGKKCACYGFSGTDRCIGVRTQCFGLVDDIKAPNMPAQEIIFNGSLYKTGDTINFNPSESCMGDIRAKLVKINNSEITLDIVEEKQMDGKYTKVAPVRQQIIKNGTCIEALPLCMDASFKYCFTSENTMLPNTYTYEIKSESLMPRPGVN